MGPVLHGAPPSSTALERDVVRASAWTIGSGLSTRLLGAIGTVVITHFISPFDAGEVQAATVLGLTANQISSLGLGTYVVANADADRPTMFHATCLHVIPGMLAFVAVLLFGRHLTGTLDAPSMFRYVPGLLLAAAIERVNFIPERVLVRQMQFGQIAVIKGVGEIMYTLGSLFFAVLGWGGMSMVMGNLARSLVRAIMILGRVPWREWIEPTRLKARQLRDIVLYGGTVSIGGFAAFAARRWDNLVVSHLFGPAVMGKYNLAYNLADIPAVQVGEQVSDVFQAAFARAGSGDRIETLLRSTSLLALVMTPMAVGLGVVGPVLTTTIFDARWQGVGPLLFWLALISFPRPISGTVGAYLQVKMMPRLATFLEVTTLALLMGALFTVGRLGPEWACMAVGLVFLLRVPFSAWLLKRTEGVPYGRFLGPMVPPIICATLMALTIVLLRVTLRTLGLHIPVVEVIAEITVGALAYIGAAFLFARRQTREFLGLMRDGFGRRRIRSTE